MLFHICFDTLSPNCTFFVPGFVTLLIDIQAYFDIWTFGTIARLKSSAGRTCVSHNRRKSIHMSVCRSPLHRVMVCAIVCSGLEDMPYFVVRKKGGTLPMVSDRSLVQTT